MNYCKLLLATITAAVLLGTLVGGAAARSFMTSSQGLRSQFRTFRFETGFGNISCQITLDGSFHSRTIAKRVGALIGYVTSASVGPCAEGQASILRETLPWHEAYDSFSGTLPNILTVRTRIIGFAFRIREPFIVCLARSTAEAPLIKWLERNIGARTLSNAILGGEGIPTSCGITLSPFTDRGTATPLNNNAGRVTVTLI